MSSSHEPDDGKELPTGDGPWRATHSNGTRSNLVYHTDPDCRRMPNNPVEVSDGEIDWYRECKVCAGDLEKQGDADWSYQRALREAAQND